MPEDPTNPPMRNQSTICPHFGVVCHQPDQNCALCDQTIVVRVAPATFVLERGPSLSVIENSGKNVFHSDSSLLFQFLPSGECWHSNVMIPLTLGRGQSELIHSELLDLSTFNAGRHGVSRHHCKIQRRDHHLVVLDLNSTNGTYLNSKHLNPFEEYVISHGDELILGTLHMVLFFQRDIG